MSTAVADDFVINAPHQSIIYLPAVNTQYASYNLALKDPYRNLPSQFTLDDLAFWTGNSSLFNHKFLLHSFGNYSIGQKVSNKLLNRAKDQFTFVGDSGGFQLGKGTIKGFNGLETQMDCVQAEIAWKNNYDAKVAIVDWLDHHSDYAMTLDIPLWSISQAGVGSPFHKCSPQQILDMTVSNLKLIGEVSNNKTKWLNVIQGVDESTIKFWWDGIKKYQFSGWAMAGATGYRGGLYNVLYAILLMRDDGAFEKQCEWVHYLGLSQPKWFVVLTAIQNQLRKYNEKIQFSCDSATAFSAAGVRDQYAEIPLLDQDINNWGIKYETLPATKNHADPASTVPFPVPSAIGKRLLMNHLVIDYREISGRRIDLLSSLMLINHSLWVILDAERRAYQAAFVAKDRPIPDVLKRVIDLIDDLFNTQNWHSLLTANKEFLDSFAKNQYE